MNHNTRQYIESNEDDEDITSFLGDELVEDALRDYKNEAIRELTHR